MIQNLKSAHIYQKVANPCFIQSTLQQCCHSVMTKNPRIYLKTNPENKNKPRHTKKS